MKPSLIEKSNHYLHRLCVEISERVVGSEGNRTATAFFAEIVESLGIRAVFQKFDCLHWTCKKVALLAGDSKFEVHASPFSLPCNVNTELCVVESIDELRVMNANEKLILLIGDIVREQLMPKGFIFYNPDEHKIIYDLLEKSGVKGIIAATSRNPSLAGGMYPFPFIEDGDFEIPSAYIKDVDGEKLKKFNGKRASLVIESTRIPEQGYNVIVNIGSKNKKKILVCAHIDSKPGTPGAIDNATGIVILLLLAEQLRNYDGNYQIEIVALNGEDYYSVPGQMKYLESLQKQSSEIALVINFDGAGYFQEATAFSMYNCPPEMETIIRKNLISERMIEGPQWIQSDHGMFVQQGIPAIAITSNNFMEKLSAEITHTPEDKPEIVDHEQLVIAAERVGKLINNF